jgi:hypothetical protein
MNNVKYDSLDALLYVSAPAAGQPDIDEYNALDIPVELSRSFRRRIKQIIKNGVPVNYVTIIAKRVAIIFLIIMSIGFTYVMSISAVREAVWEKIMEWYNNYIYVQYVEPNETETEVPATIKDYKEPATIPDTYIKTILQKLPYCYYMEYISSEHMIIYQQYILKNYSIMLTNIDSETEPININGNQGLYTFYTSGNKNYYDIIWNDKKYAYELYGDIDLNSLIKIAENIS